MFGKQKGEMMGEKTGVLAGDQLRTRPITSSHKGLKKRRSQHSRHSEYSEDSQGT